MRSLRFLFLFLLLLPPASPAQDGPGSRAVQKPAESPLDARVAQFEITDSLLRDGLSELSLKNIDGLHLGFEELIRDRIQDDPRALSPHFSLHLKDKTVRQVLDALCHFDARYTWSQDGNSVNVYPRGTEGDRRYLLNLEIERMAFKDIPDPDQALTPLSRLFPERQVGYFGPGLGDNTYAEPWTAVFEHVTVRQFINRIAEHMGPRTSWVWEGGEQERMFVFAKGGFNTQRASR